MFDLLIPLRNVTFHLSLYLCRQFGENPVLFSSETNASESKITKTHTNGQNVSVIQPKVNNRNEKSVNKTETKEKTKRTKKTTTRKLKSSTNASKNQRPQWVLPSLAKKPKKSIKKSKSSIHDIEV